mgnify:CR=1 FL=1
MFVVTVNFSVKRNQIEQFKPLMLENARLSLELEPGCKQFDVCFDSNEPWECFVPIAWYVPHISFLSQGISLIFKHAIHDSDYIYDLLKSHTQEHETLKLFDNNNAKHLYFQRC